MPGVVCVLPEPFASRVETLWEAMKREFGISRGYPGAIPHLSLHVGPRDADPEALPVVERVARSTGPFTMYAAGLGVFGGAMPVLHIAVARSPEAAALAERLNRELAVAGLPSDPYFSAERWVPHITIGHQNLAGVDLGPMLGWLARQDLAWEIPVRDIAIARETANGAEVLSKFALGG